MSRPAVGVGAIIFRYAEDEHELEILLIRRGKPPGMDGWTVPGGAVELGETLAEAVKRETDEEVMVSIDVGPLVEAVNIIGRCEQGVEYHFVVLDYLCWYRHGEARAATDAAAARWVRVSELGGVNLVGQTRAVIDSALALIRNGTYRPPFRAAAAGPFARASAESAT